MKVLIWKCDILRVTNARCGIINMRMLIKPKKQLGSFFGKNDLEVFALGIRWRLSKILKTSKKVYKVILFDK